MQLIIWRSVLAVSLIAYPMIGLAYVGPGLGAGALAVLLGIIGSIFLALFAVFWYPFKRILKRRKKKQIREDANAKQASELKEEDSQLKPENQD